MTVTVLDPHGEPYRRDNRAWIERVADGELAASTDRFHRTPWLRATLPPGRYRAQATSDPNVPFCTSGWQPFLAPYGPGVTEFELAADEELDVEVVLLEGGRVRLALPIQELPEEPLTAEALSLERHASNAFAAALHGPGAGHVELVGTTDGTKYGVDFHGPALDFTYRYRVVLPGTECLSHTIVPPGNYSLRAEIPGYEPAETAVQIRAGEITCVELALR
ncbi:PEGA domain-containing protein [Saltatorellus ferox]|uniref:PEGA domain-containing protein n=1 Tax=Saltatorellus ferox TaxID=2528018 RepID=UPI003AF350A1